MREIIERHARIGIEILDAVTDGPIIGGYDVTVEPRTDARGFDVGGRRWVSEELAPGRWNVLIEADGYVPVRVAIELASAPVHRAVRLMPSSVYPFEGAVRRILGRLAIDRDGRSEPADAEVVVTPRRGATLLPLVRTRSLASQYVAVLAGDSDGPPDRFDVDAEAVIEGVIYRGALRAAPAPRGGLGIAPGLVLLRV